MIFHCPQCHREYVEPHDAAFVLAVVCVDCADLDEYERRIAALVVVERHAA